MEEQPVSDNLSPSVAEVWLGHHRPLDVGGPAPLGATYRADSRCEFLVWAPSAKRVEVDLVGQEESHGPKQRIALQPTSDGYHHGTLTQVRPGMHYRYRLDAVKERPDPASRFQPFGVHGPSEIVDNSAFAWSDADWAGLDLHDYVFYELHVGTFTSEGTFDAAIVRLPELKDLGVTAVELMPVAQFPGSRNWGYDGAFPFAVQNSYGGPPALLKFVNACHALGLAVVLDVVYNHLGPEGNYLADFGPYFTDRYRTPWGQAINFDGPFSDSVVRFFVENALYWLRDFHVDALRLDAVHGIVDRSAQPFLALLAAVVGEFAQHHGRRVYLISESDLNDTRLLLPQARGGLGLHAQWNDDFHHALHVLQTCEQSGYYRDFGKVQQLAKAFRQGYVFTGEYSKYRQRRQGNSAQFLHTGQLVVCSQNHDQVGNRMLGERSSTLISLEAQKLSAGAVLLSPSLPLLFMGEEYAEIAPFLYFTSHGDTALGEAVRSGRRAEFAAFGWKGEPPDPQAEATFLASKLDHQLKEREPHLTLWRFYQQLLRLRKTSPALRELQRDSCSAVACEEKKSVLVRRWFQEDEFLLVFNFSDALQNLEVEIPAGDWGRVIDSADEAWLGPGSVSPTFVTSTLDLALQPRSFCAFRHVV
jgi:maltooligosyltrehalose trehalohydrolase